MGGALRHLPGLDQLIDSATRQPLPADSRARMALRIGLAGWLLLDTPPHATIATVLPLVEGGPRRLVHGVLSTLFRTKVALPPPALPEPWRDRWTTAWGGEVAAAAALRLATIPPTDLSLRDPAKTAEWAARLGGTSLLPGHVRLSGSQVIERLDGFGDGAWWVQDAAAGLPARLMGDVGGRRVLDLCAAPGGKTMQLAAAGARVTALDISGGRLKRLKANLARTGLDAEVIEADARGWNPPEPFDAILLDAPCSASGTFARHPDLLYLKGALDLAPLLALQAELVARACQWLQPGGRLVYAVCSLEPAEGEGMRPPDGLLPDPIPEHERPAGLGGKPGGATLRTLPTDWGDVGGVDGFFIARYRRA